MTRLRLLCRVAGGTLQPLRPGWAWQLGEVPALHGLAVCKHRLHDAAAWPLMRSIQPVGAQLVQASSSPLICCALCNQSQLKACACSGTRTAKHVCSCAHSSADSCAACGRARTQSASSASCTSKRPGATTRTSTSSRSLRKRGTGQKPPSRKLPPGKTSPCSASLDPAEYAPQSFKTLIPTMRRPSLLCWVPGSKRLTGTAEWVVQMRVELKLGAAAWHLLPDAVHAAERCASPCLMHMALDRLSPSRGVACSMSLALQCWGSVFRVGVQTLLSAGQPLPW